MGAVTEGPANQWVWTKDIQNGSNTVSVGAAQCMDQESAEDLVRRADEALYGAKQAGRNRAFWHDGNEVQCVGGHRKEVATKAANKKVQASTPETQPGRTTESFAAICQDLRQRMEEVSVGSSRGVSAES